MDKFLEFAGNHWKGIWVAISVIGLLASILGGFMISTGFVWLAVLIASIITVTDSWGTVSKKTGELFWALLCGWVNVAIGGRGLTAFLFINGGTLFLLGLLSMSFNAAAGGSFISAVGVAGVVGGLISIPAKKIHG